VTNITSFFLLLFLALHTQRRFFYYAYLWQLKSYRVDRLLEEIRKNKEIIFPKIYVLPLLLFLIFSLIIKRDFSDYLLVAIYLLLGSYSIFLFLKKRWKFPVFTKKILIIFAIILSFWVCLLFYFWQSKIFFLPIFEILIPFFLFFCFGAIEFPAVILKKLSMKKAKNRRKTFNNLIVVGITGSYGKSSTKEFLYSLLVEKYKENEILKTDKNINTEIGIANTVLNKLNQNHKIFVCEIGAYKMGEIKTVCDIVKPKIGILTGINEQHLATFGSQENIIKGKYELIESLLEGGAAFFNARNKYCLDLYEKTLRGGSGQVFLYAQEAQFFGQENILAARAVAKYLGMTEEEIKRGLDKITNKMPGIHIKKWANGLNVINATYSANSTGVLAHLEYLKTFSGKKVIIMPCLIELGEASKRVHREIGQKISEVCDLAIITTKDRFKEIREGAGDKAVLIENPQKIIERINNFVKAGDVVLLESRVPSRLIDYLLK
jgi:UDP-N-acetylmuramoyl-tripeptide--D-alanyl-D-alanine ligase